MSTFEPKCPHCHKSTNFQPTAATQAQWLELKSRLRSPEAADIKSSVCILSGAEEDLRRCQDEIKRQSGYLITLENQRKMLEKHVDAVKALTAPIRRIPLEVLESILGFSVAENYISSNCIKIPGQRFAEVCYHWRVAALAEKQLWSTIHLGSFLPDLDDDQSYGAESLTQAVQLILDRSGSFPLNVKITHMEEDFDLQASWSLALDQSRRWRSLTVSLLEGASMAILPRYLSAMQGGLPMLEYLQISGEEELQTEDQEIWNLFRDAATLHTVSLEDEVCFKLVLPCDQIRRVNLIHPPDLVAALTRFPQITEATINPSTVVTAPAMSPPLLIPHVESLILRITNDVAPDSSGLSSMSMPALTALTICPVWFNRPQRFGRSDFDQFIAQSRCQITTLTMTGDILVRQDFFYLLRALPQIHTCTISIPATNPADPMICHNFFEQLGEPHRLLPKLERLTMSSPYSWIASTPGIFLKAIRSRCNTTSLCEDTACLKYLSLVFPKVTFDRRIIEGLEHLAAVGMVVAVKDSTGFVVG
ncbi:hypothetical protein C8J56DRAFT_79628 [Mycena floridula]|nr:hypothetical protein C8J56DRAFT_79628 [Mycena floridula]